MPIYEYRCNACQKEFEYQQKMSDPDLVTCEACGENKLEKLISWTAVRSTGWDAALYSKNPKEAMKGMTAVDRSRPPSAKAEATSVTPAAAPSTETATDAAATTPAASDAAATTATAATTHEPDSADEPDTPATDEPSPPS